MASNIFEFQSNSFDTFGMLLTNLNKLVLVVTTMLVLYIIVTVFFLPNYYTAIDDSFPNHQAMKYLSVIPDFTINSKNVGVATLALGGSTLKLLLGLIGIQLAYWTGYLIFHLLSLAAKLLTTPKRPLQSTKKTLSEAALPSNTTSDAGTQTLASGADGNTPSPSINSTPTASSSSD
jgi:hypothetical protein